MSVFAILRSSVWGFVQPRTPPEIGGTEITPLGFSPTPFLVLAGLALLWAFVAWEQRRERQGQDALLERRCWASRSCGRGSRRSSASSSS